MKFKIHVCNESDESREWWEEYTKDISDPDQYGKEIIDFFNQTLRPHESRRKYLGYEILGSEKELVHNWEKTNLVTIIKGTLSFDTYKCSKCGTTGKKYGLSHSVTIDPKYKGKRTKCKY